MVCAAPAPTSVRFLFTLICASVYVPAPICSVSPAVGEEMAVRMLVKSQPVAHTVRVAARAGAGRTAAISGTASSEHTKTIRVGGGPALLDRAHRGRFGTRPRVPKRMFRF